MNIISENSTKVIVDRENGIKLLVTLEVDNIYFFDPIKPTTKKDRKNKGRIVKILGFTDDFSPDGVIVRYLDNNRRGRVNPCALVPFNM